MPPELSELLYLDRATDFSYVITAIALLGLSTLSLLMVDFWHSPGAALRDTLILSVVICYFALVYRSVGWLRRVHPAGDEAKDYIAVMTRLLVLLGVVWAALLFVLTRAPDTSQLCLLYGIMVGCVATPVMVTPISCALAYWVPISGGICLALLTARNPAAFAILDLLSFVGLTGFCILYLNRRLNERAIGAIRLEENGAVIKLLLRDFEESASDWLWETNAGLELQQVSQRLAQVAHRGGDVRGSFRAPCWARL